MPMHYGSFEVKSPLKLQRIRSIEDLAGIEFVDGIAEVEVPVDLLDQLPLKNYERSDSPRLDAVVRSIRAKGYSSIAPIVCRMGALGRWVVVDGGHRLTAAMRVANSFWNRLFKRDLGDVTFILFETESSYTRLTTGKSHTLSPRQPAGPQASAVPAAKAAPARDED